MAKDSSDNHALKCAVQVVSPASCSCWLDDGIDPGGSRLKPNQGFCGGEAATEE